MWTPGLAAILTSLILRRSLKEMGWSLRPVKWLAFSWLMPILYGFLAYVPLWLTGLGSVPNPTFLERARLTLNLSTGPDFTVILAAFGYITLVNLLPSMIFSLGEEIGWRGFLVPELSKWMSLRNVGLVSGLIWGVWHLPGILSGGYGADGTPLAFQITCFMVMVISSGIIFAWVRIKSGSLWTAVILHAVHNNVIQAFFDRITADTGYTKYFTGEFGLALPIVIAIISYLIWRQLDKEKQPELTLSTSALPADL
jgi:membrane protease YdiL (CAAX protease family)